MNHDVETDEMREREATARHALAAFRERRRQRRAEDTWFGSAACLLGGEPLSADETHQRRVEIMDAALEIGMSAELAELLYDVALDEGLEPALAFELVRCGLGICPPPDGVANTPSQPTVDKYAPEWVVTPPTPPDLLLRERMLRLSFRRLRALLERHETPEEALRAFAREPDVGVNGY